MGHSQDINAESNLDKVSDMFMKVTIAKVEFDYINDFLIPDITSFGPTIDQRTYGPADCSKLIENNIRERENATFAGSNVCVSDINVPAMIVLELLDQAKARFPYINVSTISAYGDADNYNRAIQSGAKEFFIKQSDFESLKKEILALKD